MKCKSCGRKLEKFGIAIDSISYLKYDSKKDVWELIDLALLPHDDSDLVCGYCGEKLDTKLPENINLNFSEGE